MGLLESYRPYVKETFGLPAHVEGLQRETRYPRTTAVLNPACLQAVRHIVSSQNIH